MKRKGFSAVRVIARLIIILIVPALACSGNDLLVRPTRLAPDDLSGQDFSNARISGQDLSGKNMQQVNLSGTQIFDSNFSRADLRSADLTNTLIQRTTFANADLRGAKLDHACMDDETVWTDAQLDAKWARFIALLEHGIEPGQDLRGYDLSNVCFWFNHLNRANLAGVELIGAKIFQSDLAGANLTNSNLRNANITASDLQETDLTGADLTGAKLTGVNMVGAIVTQEQLNAAVLDCVRLPDGSKAGKCYGDGP